MELKMECMGGILKFRVESGKVLTRRMSQRQIIKGPVCQAKKLEFHQESSKEPKIKYESD